MLSLILPVYKNKVLTEYCLANIEKWVPADAELIVVDDASGYETAQVIKKYRVSKLIIHEQNKGNTVAYNSGAQAAKGDILIFLDSDIILFDQSIRKFQNIFEFNENIGVVGTLLLYPKDNTIQHAGVAFDKWVMSHIYNGRKVEEIDFNDREERQAVTAAYFACKKSLFEKVGGFNESYRDGLEDIEFCLKAKEFGTKIIISSEIRAFHFESATRGQFKYIRRTYNYSIFFSRWYNKFTQDLNIYLDRNLSKKAINDEFLRGTMTVVNFCNTPNWLDLIERVKLRGAQFYSIHDLSGFIGETNEIELHRQVPISFQSSPYPLLFVVDHFSQLQSNRNWFKQRVAPDLIIDRHANAVLSSRWTQG